MGRIEQWSSVTSMLSHQGYFHHHMSHRIHTWAMWQISERVLELVYAVRCEQQHKMCISGAGQKSMPSDVLKRSSQRCVLEATFS